MRLTACPELSVGTMMFRLGKVGCMDAKQRFESSSYKRREDLSMWRAARDYYFRQGWSELVNAAEKQIARLLDDEPQRCVAQRAGDSEDSSE